MRTVTMWCNRTPVELKLIERLLKKHRHASHVFCTLDKIELCVPCTKDLDVRLVFNYAGELLYREVTPQNIRATTNLQYINVPTLPRNYKGVV